MTDWLMFIVKLLCIFNLYIFGETKNVSIFILLTFFRSVCVFPSKSRVFKKKVIRICFVSRLITVVIVAHALAIKGGK